MRNRLSLGEENSWLRIQNLGGQPATVDLAFYDLQGNKVASDGCPKSNVCEPIGPGLGWSFFQQGYSELADGYRGSAFVTSDQPFVALLARDVFKGGQFQIAGDTLKLGRGTPVLYLPIVQNNAQYASRISVQNSSDASDACVQIEYWAEGSVAVTAIDPPGPTAGCPNGGVRVPPRGTLLRDETSLPVDELRGRRHRPRAHHRGRGRRRRSGARRHRRHSRPQRRRARDLSRHRPRTS